MEKNIHFIGIGGIGVSALARYYLYQGYKIFGSDIVSSEITDSLKKLGAKISTGAHNSKNLLKNTNLVIYSPAISMSNPEIKEAKKQKIKIQSYPQALGDLTKTHFTIAISGSHGKSTTTSMVGLLLKKAGLDPTVIVGTKLKEFNNTNYRNGKSNAENLFFSDKNDAENDLSFSAPKNKFSALSFLSYLVIEADEHFNSFLNYSPKIIILTSLEADHLDYFKTFSNLKNTFKKFIAKLPKDGVLIYNQDDKNIQKIQNPKSKIQKIGYSFRQDDANKIKKILKVPGEHNVSNALAALTLARYLGISDKISFKALSEFNGTWRRFEILKTKPFILISDYAHHPTEIKATLKATREKFPNKRIICVFQPHQYQRTLYLFKDFVKVLRDAPVDKLIITDIYKVLGREPKDIEKKVNSEKLAKTINKPSVIFISTFDKIENYLKQNIKKDGVVIIMGAGDIYKINAKIKMVK